jgi:nitrate/TMAO reductase-like tetraheme cytochrome c subunit
MRREKMRPRRRRESTEHPRQTRLFMTLLPAIVFAAVAFVGGGTVAAVKYTEQPKFCSTCHEMAPYHEAWSKGAHKGVSCVSCHVDPGNVARYSHKVMALKEVYDHFTSEPKFPGNDADVPSARCTSCHTDLPRTTKAGFPHSQHIGQGPCISCHADTGHKVTVEALSKARILSAKAKSQAVVPSVPTTSTHVPVNCTKCHDVATTPCDTCHKAPHVARGTCTTCHSTGPRWAFAHPPAGAVCSTCHERPKNHFQGTCATCHSPQVKFALTVYRHTSTTCATCHAKPAEHIATKTQVCFTCHTKPGVAWTFTHPAKGANCAVCHSAPAKHFGSACASCHAPGIPFAQAVYRHTSKDCASCHQPPSGHYKGSCASCHKPTVPFASTRFVHSKSTACASCHSKPSRHVSTTSSCYTCHRNPGRTWTASHPSSKSCASCHRPPASHYGSGCSSCHTPGTSFSATRFRHPAANMPHSISGKQCTDCHPGGNYQRVGCRCHGGGRPTDD